MCGVRVALDAGRGSGKPPFAQCTLEWGPALLGKISTGQTLIEVHVASLFCLLFHVFLRCNI